MIWVLFGKLLSALNFLAALLIVGIMLLITADVVGRSFFSFPLYGVPELTKFSIICMAWLQMAYTLHARQHLRSTLILNALPKLPRRTVIVLNCLAGAAVMTLIAYYSYPEMVRAYRFSVFEGEHPVRVPTWPIWAIIVGGSALTGLEYAGQAVQTLLGRGDRPDDPVPAIE